MQDENIHTLTKHVRPVPISQPDVNLPQLNQYPPVRYPNLQTTSTDPNSPISFCPPHLPPSYELLPPRLVANQAVNGKLIRQLC